VPAKIPIGVPAITAMTLIRMLPPMALARPPLLPGGGVISVKSVGDRAEMPSTSSPPRMNVSHIKPNRAAPMESTTNTRLARRRRK